MAITIHSRDWSLTVDQDWIDVTSSHATPHERWRYTDSNGHDHRYEPGYPTLNYVIDASHWCNGNEGLYSHDPHEAVDEAHYECSICGEVIEPAMDPPYTPKQIPGMRSARIDGRKFSNGWVTEYVIHLSEDEFEALQSQSTSPDECESAIERFVAEYAGDQMYEIRSSSM